MQEFHKLLTRFINEKNTTIYTLAKNTGIERSYIQKMKSGARIPGEKSTILKLAKGLMLTANESAQLVQAYSIAKMGEGKYYQRMFVQNIISSFAEVQAKNSLILECNTQNNLVMSNDYEHISGVSAVHKVLRAVMEIEASKEDGCIRIIAQPSFSYIYDCISTLNSSTNVENIITLYKQDNDNTINYNLDVFQKLVPLFFSCPHFHPFYVHDHVDTIFNDTTVLPVTIITSDYLLRIANDCKQALLVRDEKIRQLYLASFDKKKLNSKPIFDTISAEPEQYFANTAALMDFDGEANYNIMYQPCIIPYIPSDTVNACINTDVLTSEMLSQINEYLYNLSTCRNTFQMVFTEEGLDMFLRTGKIVEIPHFMLRANPTKKQRLEIIANFIAAMEDGRAVAHIAKPNLFAIPKPIVITAYSKQQVIIHHFDESGSIHIFRLEEISLVNAFHDFLMWIQDCDLVYTQEESLEILQNVYKKHFNNVYR